MSHETGERDGAHTRIAAEELRQGRAAFERRAWANAYGHLSSANELAPLDAADLEQLAAAAYLIGKDEVSLDLWTRAHHQRLRHDDPAGAARCAFWIVLDLSIKGELAQASGWLVRARRLLDEGHHDCPERGLLLVLAARLLALRGEMLSATEMATEAAALAERFDDPDLKVFGRLILAQVRARSGDIESAAVLFDEIMVAVTVGEVSPIAVGTIYCAVIEACHASFDLHRAREWTAALSRWCGTQPELVRFWGQCLVHRAEILRLSGAWSQAANEAKQACAAANADTPSLRSTVGAAFYELAEIHRVRGNFDDAEEAYRHAAQFGRSPEPGLALLRLAQGKADVAVSSVRRLLDETRNPMARAAALAACTEIMIAARDLAAARAAADELATLGRMSNAPFLRAISAQANGGVLLSEERSGEALAELRAAWMTWQELDAPYEAARVRVLLALACRTLGDYDAAELELEAASRVFERLEARPDTARVATLLQKPARVAGPPLTTRELQVIRLIAGGKTNRAIAQQLAISERTVDRHVGNILRKLQLSSRSAATAYAYDHGLV